MFLKPVVHGSSGLDLFFFKVLKHPIDAYAGRPRGKQEILENLRELGAPKRTIICSDCWLGTIAAVKQYRRENNFTEEEMPHELVNHSQGEIVNSRGFTTNGIEAKWSVLKRWIRKRYAGKLPRGTDRAKWARLIGEFRFRKFMQAMHFRAHGDTCQFVAFESFVQAFVV